MRRILPAVIALLALTACSATGTDAATDPAPTEAQSASARPADAVNDEGAAEPASDEEPSARPSETSSSSPSAPEEYGEQTTTEHGLLLKRIGQLGGLVGPEGNPTIDLTATEVVVDPECTAEFSEPATNGHYLALHFDVKTYPELSEMPYPRFVIIAHDFKVWDADGVRVNDPVPDSRCLSEEDLLPDEILPGEHVQGWVVLDALSTSGSIGFTPGGQPGGWEWEYGE